MPHYLPDAESITDYCGAYEARGCTFDIVAMSHQGGYGLRMSFGEGSSARPIFPLPAARMQTVADAERWMAHVRDELMQPFAHILEKRQPREPEQAQHVNY